MLMNHAENVEPNISLNGGIWVVPSCERTGYRFSKSVSQIERIEAEWRRIDGIPTSIDMNVSPSMGVK